MSPEVDLERNFLTFCVGVNLKRITSTKDLHSFTSLVEFSPAWVSMVILLREGRACMCSRGATLDLFIINLKRSQQYSHQESANANFMR